MTYAPIILFSVLGLSFLFAKNCFTNIFNLLAGIHSDQQTVRVKVVLLITHTQTHTFKQFTADCVCFSELLQTNGATGILRFPLSEHKELGTTIVGTVWWTILKHKLGQVTVSTKQMACPLFAKRKKNEKHKIQDKV